MRGFHNSVMDAALGPTDLRGHCDADAIDIKVLQTLGMARDRPSPYDERGLFFFTVARGPVPRDLPT